MKELKESACSLALRLLSVLENIDDEEFIDNICFCISSNDDYTVKEIRNELFSSEE